MANEPAPIRIAITQRSDGTFRVAILPRDWTDYQRLPCDFPNWIAADAHARQIAAGTGWRVIDRTFEEIGE